MSVSPFSLPGYVWGRYLCGNPCCGPEDDVSYLSNPQVFADYLFSRAYPISKTCGGEAIQTVANYLGESSRCLFLPNLLQLRCTFNTGCLSPAGQKNPISFTWACVNSTSALVNYHEGSACAGPVVHSAPISVDSHCAAGSSEGSSQAICAFGDYHPSPDTINVNVFLNEKNSCPISPRIPPSGIVEFEFERCFTDGTSSYWYGCSPTAMTGVAFDSVDCSGTPHPSPLIPLGCFANATDHSGSPQFTICPGRVAATVEAAKLRGAKVVPAPTVLRALSVAVDDAVAVETARASALVAAARV